MENQTLTISARPNEHTALNSASQHQQTVGPLDKIVVSYADTVKKPLQSKPLSWVIEQIRTSPTLQSKIAKVRAVKDQAERQELKKQILPIFYFQHFVGKRHLNKDFASTRFITIDIDHIGDRIPELRKKLKNDQEVFMHFLSPSGDGLKVTFALEFEIRDDKNYRAAFQYFRNLVTERYGVPTDGDDDPARACYFSADAELVVNTDCSLHKPPVANTLVPKNKNERQLPPKVQKALPGSASPGRTEGLSALIGYLNSRGVEQEVALSVLVGWNKTNTPPLDEAKVKETVNDEYARYAHQSSIRPVSIIEQDNCYYRTSKSGSNVTKKNLTNFVITPKELLVLDDSDCLSCSVTTSQGYTYEDLIIENSAWTSKAKLLNAIGHQDCSFFGSDPDIQTLCHHVNSQVTVRKRGTNVIGLVEDTWVIENINITASGLNPTLSIVPYERGSDALYHRLAYQYLNEDEYTTLVSGLYENVGSVNTETTIMPMLGWMFAVPVKPMIMEYQGSFPLLFVHGSQGSGKTSTASLFMRLMGYEEHQPHMCDMRPFPLLKLLSATNAVPVFLDEFKVADMKEETVDNLLRFMRKSYDGELESKGHADQSVQDYALLAPLVVMGEWNINQPAIKERIVFPRFSNAVKTNQSMKDAFKNLRQLPLEGFMPRYVEFLLNQDIKKMYDESQAEVQKHFSKLTVAPRIIHNLSVMTLGLNLFEAYGKECEVSVPSYKLGTILDSQLLEITGTSKGFVKSAVDQLIEELGFMAQKNEKEIVSTSGYEPTVKIVPWYKVFTLEETKLKCLAIRFNKIFPEFKKYAKDTKYEGDLLDKESYMRMFDECEYIVGKSHGVKIDGKVQRCLCIDIDKAKAAGLDLEGFGIE
jgi:hypothetical protein